MDWPLEYESGSKLSWSDRYQPRVLSDQNLTIKLLADILQSYEPTFPQKQTKFDFKPKKISNFSYLWFVFMFIIIPITWFIIMVRIVQELRQGTGQTEGLEFTLLFIILLAFTFSFVGVYSLYRRHQFRLDLFDQLDLLYYHFHEEEITPELLSIVIEEKNGKLYWKKYYLSWELSNLFPTISVIDIVAIFLAMFNQIYVMAWLVNLLLFLFTNDQQINTTGYLILIDSILLISFLLLLFIGAKFGISQHPNLSLHTKTASTFQIQHLLVIILSIAIILVIDLVMGQITLVFLVVLLFGQLPLISAFVTNRLQYLRNYIHIRSALRRQLEFLRYQKPDTSLNYQIREATTRLDAQSLLPTSRLRSYVLIVTAIISILIPVLTGFFSSVSRLNEIIELIFPI